MKQEEKIEVMLEAIFKSLEQIFRKPFYQLTHE